MKYTRPQTIVLLLLRISIGWHFLYEGIIKLSNPSWSAIGYLLDSKGFLSGLFYWMAANNGILKWIDFLNIWGLILIGLGLILGFLTRYAILGGIMLLAFYYLSHPPFVGLEYAMPAEGTYLWVDKNLIELFALMVLLLFPISNQIGVDRLFNKQRYSE